MPRRSGDDQLTGVMVVDKPAGMTSHDVVAVVRRAAGQRKVGHTGTLDPEATGVLVCCLGRATRLARFLQAGRKTYAARMVLGRTTSTQDAAGEVVRETDASRVTEHDVCVALTRFQGPIEQVPPMVSAVKVDGERLHVKARRGEEVEREPRAVTIHQLVLEDFEPGPRAEASFLVTCSSGTYVRTLAHDIGEDLGVGGSLVSLRRVANGGFGLEDAYDLDTIRAAGERDEVEELLLTPREAVRDLPLVEVRDADLLRGLTQGKPLPAQGSDDVYAVVAGDRLVGLYRDREGQGRPEAVLLRPEELHPDGLAPAGDGTRASEDPHGDR